MADDKLTEVLAIRCYKSEALVLRQVAEQYQTTPSKLLRRLALDLLTTAFVILPVDDAVSDKLTITVAARVSEREDEALADLARRNGVTVSRLVRGQIGRSSVLTQTFADLPA